MRRRKISQKARRLTVKHRILINLTNVGSTPTVPLSPRTVP